MVTNDNASIDTSRATEKARPYASVEAFGDLHQVQDEWRELFAQAPVSPYQSFEFISAWSETLGKAQGLEPMIIVARDQNRRPLALLPFAIAKSGPLRVATFLSGRESNFNLALFRRNVEFDRCAILGLLKDAATIPPRPDLYLLRNQPMQFGGTDNPLLFSHFQPSPSSGYGTTLPSDAISLESRSSKETRKKLRKKETRLGELGEISYEHNASGARSKAILDTLIAQKTKRLKTANIISNLQEQSFKEFLTRIAALEDDGALELHALTLSGRVVAAYAGLTHAGRFSAMLNSYDMNEDIARCSPGDLLLHALLRNLISRGFTHFDLGAGEARYKNAVCDQAIELHDTILPITAKGISASPAISLALRMKRKAKRTPWMSRVVATVRNYIKL